MIQTKLGGKLFAVTKIIGLREIEEIINTNIVRQIVRAYLRINIP